MFGPLLAGALAFTACSQRPLGSAALPLAAAARTSGETQLISHIVVMVQENRSFDDLFATFPGVDGATQGLMKTSHGDIDQPLKKAPLESDSLGHEHQSFELEYDKGMMDGFGLVKRALKRGKSVKAGVYAYRYVNPDDIKPYWTIAQQYVLGDHMFMTQGSSSFTAHQDLIAGGTPYRDGENIIDFPVPPSWGCDAPPGTVTSLITGEGRLRRDRGPYPCFEYSTLRDLLDAKGASWLYFTNTSQSSVWNAYDAIAAVRYGPEWESNIVKPETQIFQTISNGTLPAVSWVIPDSVNSDHPGNHSDTGPSWVASVVNAIGQSAYWPSTAIVVVWDDWGGQYDNVPPPQLDGQGLGMRVPVLIISPYARETSPSQLGYISHTQYEFGSIVRLIEDSFNLGRLGTTDMRAHSMFDSFDFSQRPRTFTPIPAKYPKTFFEHQGPSGLPLDTD